MSSTVPDIIKFTYYHCTSIDYSVLCEWSTQYFKCAVPDIIHIITVLQLTTVHCTLWMNYTVLGMYSTWHYYVYILSLYFQFTTVYFECTTQYKCKGNSHITMIRVQSCTIGSTVDYHLIKLS